jgi:glycosyltransferase involved in cell wall biosynthesis
VKLLLVHRFIRPDAPGYAHMLYIMGKHFAAEGHEVTIFSAQPSYNEDYDGEKLPTKQFVDGMTVIRTPLLKETKKNAILRSLNFLIFCTSLFCHAVFRRHAYDLMTVTTFPPTIMGLTARTIGLFRKTKYVFHCMDLYPEVALTSGILKRKWLTNIAARIDKRNCQKAEAVVLLSSDMQDTVERRGVSSNHLHVINNFIIDELDPNVEIPKNLQNKDNKFRVLFAGNIGRFQGLDAIVEAAKLLADEKEIEFCFVGFGVMVDSLKKQAGDLLNDTISFHDYLPIATAMGVIAQSQLGIVSLSPGVVDCAYPSKTMTYLESGCKLLTLVEPHSELAQFVENEKIGIVCDGANPEDLAAKIRDEFTSWKTDGQDRESIRNTGRKFFGQPYILGCWTELIRSMDK